MSYGKRGLYPRFSVITIRHSEVAFPQYDGIINYPRALVYDVAPYRKLCITKNNSPRNDMILNTKERGGKPPLSFKNIE